MNYIYILYIYIYYIYIYTLFFMPRSTFIINVTLYVIYVFNIFDYFIVYIEKKRFTGKVQLLFFRRFLLVLLVLAEFSFRGED